MTLKRRIWDFYVATIRKFYVQRKPDNSNRRIIENTALCFVTIAFNNDFLIEEQIRLVKKHIIDSNYIHIVADNSSDKKKRKAIKAICTKTNIPYFGLPFNWFSKIHKLPSYSHGLAMTWVYYNLIKKIKPGIFGFIDHDIFPIKPYSLLQKMDYQDFYGRLTDITPDSHHRKLWFLWAGFCFYKFDSVKCLNMNFMPCKVDDVYFDSAGSNYSCLYSKYDMERLHFTAPVVEEYFREGNVHHSDLLHFVDNDWLHTINGSNWKKVKDKDDFLREFLKQY